MLLQELIITSIDSIQTVSRTKGQCTQITDRKWYGLSFCLEGQLTYRHREQEYISTPGCAIFLPKGQSYTIETDRTGQFPLINFQCQNPPSDTIIAIPLTKPNLCIAEFESMKQLFLLPHSRLRVMELFYGVLSRIASGQDPDSAVLAPALQYLEEHLDDPTLSNAILASRLGFSEVHFRKLFTRLYGASPRQYILELRIRRAKQLLTDGIESVTAISERCGFSSVYHFSRCFRVHTGMTPTEYSRQNRISKL